MNNRYARQMLFPPIGERGQVKLKDKHVLVVGLGALGSHISEQLVRAGVGKLTLIDRDYVEWSNLQRQTLYTEKDAKDVIPKAVAAKKMLHKINAEVVIESIVGEADAPFLETTVPLVNLMMDGTDNFDIRFLMNDVAMKYSVPWIFGACVASFGASFTIVPHETPCLQCLLKKLPLQGQSCDSVGIIGPTVQMVTAYQVAEALKLLTNNTNRLRTSYTTFDLWHNENMSIKTDYLKDQHCKSCGATPTYPFLTNATLKSNVLCGRDTVQIRTERKMKDLKDKYNQWMEAGYIVKGNPFLLSVQKEHIRMVLFQDGRAFVHGTNDIPYAQYVYTAFMQNSF